MDRSAIDFAAARRAARDNKRKAKDSLAYASEEDDDESVEYQLPPPPKRTKKEKRAEARRKAKQWAEEERLKAEQMWLPAAAGPIAVAVAYDPKNGPSNIRHTTLPTMANSTSRVTAPASKKAVAYVPPHQVAKKPVAFVPAPARPAAYVPPPSTIAPTLRPVPYVPPLALQPTEAPKAARNLQNNRAPAAYQDTDEHSDGYETASESEVPAVAEPSPVVDHEPNGINRIVARGRRLRNCLQAKLVVGLKLLIVALVAVAAFGLLASITWFVVGMHTTIGKTTTTTLSMSAFDRCFMNTRPNEVAYSARCSGSAAANQLLPCPPGGICKGGKLVSCGLDMSMTGTALIVSPDGMSCELTVEAQSQVQTLVERLQELSVANMCFEGPSTTVRNQGSSTSSSAMFDYFDLVQGLKETSPSAWFETLTWLKFVLDNKLASGLTLHWDLNEPILIGLSPDAMQQLSLPLKCLAQRALVSSLESTKYVLWDLIVKWTAMLLWSVFLERPGYCTGLALLAYSGVSSYSNRKLSRQRKDEIERGMELVEKCLKLNGNKWSNANTIRDTVKTQLYPGDRAAQARFVGHSWKRMLRIVDKDERIRLRTKLIDGKFCDVWMWEGLMD